MRIHFQVYNVKNFQYDLARMRKDAQKDMQVGLNAAADVLLRALRPATPNSKTSGRSWRRRAMLNRAKWGVLKKALGRYPTRLARLKANEIAGVNVGYLPSKQKKAFVSLFQNRGAYNVITKRFEPYHSGFAQRVEQANLTNMNVRYAERVGELISRRAERHVQKWANKSFS